MACSDHYPVLNAGTFNCLNWVGWGRGEGKGESYQGEGAGEGGGRREEAGGFWALGAMNKAEICSEHWRRIAHWVGASPPAPLTCNTLCLHTSNN